jgi:hypothetical protein
MWRRTREIIFRKIGVKPKLRTPQSMAVKMNGALRTIGATETETKQIIELTKLANQRVVQRKEYGANGSAANDGVMVQLREKAEKLLGKKRADKFFGICNDPYA